MLISKTLDLVPSAKIVALTGAGGKTSLMYALAKESASLGRKTAIMTTTHIGPPIWEEFELWTTGSEAELDDIWQRGKTPVAAAYVKGMLRSPDIKAQELICSKTDALWVEADGAKRHSIKFPAVWEPVIPRYTDEIIVCAGLSALAGDIDAVCYRADLARSRLGITAQQLSEPDFARIIAEGYGRYCPTVVLNHADDESTAQKGETIKTHLAKLGIIKTHIISLRKLGLEIKEEQL